MTTAILKNRKTTMCPQRFDRLARNVTSWRIYWPVEPYRQLKLWTFKNPRWRAAPIVKTVKSPSLSAMVRANVTKCCVMMHLSHFATDHKNYECLELQDDFWYWMPLNRYKYATVWLIAEKCLMMTTILGPDIFNPPPNNIPRLSFYVIKPQKVI